MSLNVYFTQEIQKLDDFRVGSHKDGSTKRSIDGLSLHDEYGRLYAIMNQNSVLLLPGHIKDCIEEVSFYETIPQMGKRVAGIYRHKSAEGELEPDPYSRQAVYKVQIKGRNMDDIRELFRMIKVGSIRPEPEDSYENTQTTVCSRAQLEAELEGAYMQRDDLSRRLDLSEATFRNAEDKFRKACDKNVSLRRLAAVLRKEFWKFGSKNAIAKSIDDILDGVFS